MQAHLVGMDAAVDKLARPQLQQQHAEAVHIRGRPHCPAVQRLGRGVRDGAWRTGDVSFQGWLGPSRAWLGLGHQAWVQRWPPNLLVHLLAAPDNL